MHVAPGVKPTGTPFGYTIEAPEDLWSSEKMRSEVLRDITPSSTTSKILRRVLKAQAEVTTLLATIQEPEVVEAARALLRSRLV